KFISTPEPGTGSNGAPITLLAYCGPTEGSGDIIIPSILTGGANLAVVAGGDIIAAVSSPPGVPVGTAGLTISPPTVIQTNGGSILLVAGAQFSEPVAGDPSVVSITGCSTCGGKVDLSNTDYISSGSAAGSGGDITIVAFKGLSPDSGTVSATQIFSGADMLS